MLEIDLDWHAYYMAFSEAHGGSPVPWRGRLLFQDGWTYSSSDHAGPEWGPPAKEEELRGMQVHYWRARLGIARQEEVDLRGKLNWLAAMQRMKSMPLLQRLKSWGDPETGIDGIARPKLQTEIAELDLSALEQRLGFLAEDVAVCEEQLARLETKEQMA